MSAAYTEETILAGEDVQEAFEEDVFVFPLSFAQQRLWFLDQLDPGSTVYNCPVALRLSGRLDVAALERALSEIVQRHEVLRTTFQSIDGEPMQVVSPPEPLQLAILDLQVGNDSEREAEAQRLAQAEAARPFDLSTGPLLRTSLLRLSDTEHVLLVTLHHIVSDGWSTAILIRELSALYTAYSTGMESPLSELPIQYADYSMWQREWLDGEVLEEQLQYWRQQLAGAPEVLELPTDRVRPAVQTFNGANTSFRLSEEVSAGLQRLSREQGVTLFMTMLAAFQTLLSRYTGQEDIVIGSAIANRNRVETEPLIGFFVNTLALRTDLSGNPSFVELLHRVKEVTLGAYAHQEVPFERLVEELAPRRELSHAPLFQVMLALQNAPVEQLQLGELELRALGGESRTAKFDLTLSVTESGGVLRGSLGYNTDLFDAWRMQRMVEHFTHLAESIVRDPHRPLSELRLLSATEEHQQVVEWNETRRDYKQQGNGTMQELFERQAAATPNAVAVSSQIGELSYQQLNEQANQLAHYLQAQGVGAETRVAVLLERSPTLIVTLLAILKAGGAYVPLDPTYPQERLRFMLEDAEVAVLITQEQLGAGIASGSEVRVNLEQERDNISAQSKENPQVTVSSQNLAYLIYTSGSTGRPKGVAIEHRNAVTLINWAYDAFSAEELACVLASTSICFDLSVFEIFVPLSGGGSLVLVENALQLATSDSSDSVPAVTLINTVPSAMAELARLGRIPSTVKSINLAGEALKGALVRQLYEQASVERVLNLYGPSEDTTYSTYTAVAKGSEGEPTIGRPIANTQVYVLDKQQRVVPVGVAGELYIGGDGLARGYLNEAVQTAQRFVPNPYSREAGARLYRTGDLARLLPNGEIEFLGRLDHQVKVRGFRIELGEIELALLGHEAVRECVVMAREDAEGDKRLVAYLTAQPDTQLSTAELRNHLRERLPDYMVPSAFIVLEHLPLTPNGKVDRRALPAPEQRAGDAEFSYVAPRTPVEELLAGLWSEVLRVERVGAEDNFFELGGHSLLATQLVSRIREAFGVELPLRALFEQPTVCGLAARVEQLLSAEQGVLAPPLTPVSREQALPLSFAQQRLWFLNQLEPESSFYNVPAGVRLSGVLNVEALERALSEIVRRHEVLRTTFQSVDGEPVQVIGEAGEVPLPLLDLCSLPESEREAEAERLAQEEAARPFDLSTGPLLRTTLLRLAADEHILLVTLHHIVSDGWSTAILIRELSALYTAYSTGMESPLSELPVQYADYSVWQRNWLQGEVLEEQLGYWRQQLAGAPEVLELPTDRVRPAVQSFRGASTPFQLSEEVSAGLQRLSREQGVTLFMTMLAAFQTLLSRYSGQAEIVVGTPIAGRTRSESEALIGFFVNTLALRTSVEAEMTFVELLRRVREVTLGAYAHQEVPFERLVEELAPRRELSHAPLFQVMLALQNAPVEQLQLGELELRALGGESRTAKFDLTLSVTESGGVLRGSLGYNTDLFDAWRMQRMARHFEQLMGSIAQDAQQAVGEIELLGEEERHQQVVEWNETRSDYKQQGNGTMQELFERQAAATPHAVAVSAHDEQLTYQELNEQANQLAHYLQAQGVSAETRVAVLLERSPQLIISLLAILKAGGAYVPLDPAYPQERLRFMLEDAEVAVLVTQEWLSAGIASGAEVRVNLDDARAAIYAQSRENPQVTVSAQNLAYLIYTSGSTGRPKGVAIEHRNAVTLINWAYDAFSAEELACVLASTSICFDLSVFEIFVPLSGGGSLVLVENALQLAVSDDVPTVTLINTVPSAMAELARLGRIPSTVKSINLAGEALKGALVRQLYEQASVERVLNLYGPSEDTTYSTYTAVAKGSEGEPTIGRPIANTQVYVLDKQQRVVPVGVAGELYIGGDGLARGYLNRPELSAAKFVPNPYSTMAGARMYRTGDLALYQPDGEIEFLGRLDHQVKVRGFRIELGEIESRLVEHEAVRECIVMAREDAEGDKRLVAYLTVDGESGEAIGVELRAYLKERLPEYMIPSAFVVLERLPLTPNGKVDKRALPEIERGKRGKEEAYVAPRDAVELQLARVWEGVLGVRMLGVKENFFELGGHSMLAVRLMAGVEQQFGLKLPLASLFQGATIEAQAALVRRGRREESPQGSLVNIQPDGTKTPFFFVHPVGGNALCYVSLARHLGQDQPFYAFESQGLHDGEQPLPSEIETMATLYIEAMRAVQAEGPYMLGGWSMGGVVAFEMARQLNEQGQEVAMLALLDSSVAVTGHGPQDASPSMDAASMINFALDLGITPEQLGLVPEEMLERAPEEQLACLLGLAHEAGIITSNIGLSQFEGFLKVYQNNLRAMRSYVPQAARVGRVLLFKAEERQDAYAEDATRGWSQMADGGVEVYTVAGNHFSMLREPHVRTLAEQLGNCLSQARI